MCSDAVTRLLPTQRQRCHLTANNLSSRNPIPIQLSFFFLNSWKGNPVLRVDSDVLQVSGNAVVGNAAFTMPATFRWSLLTVRRF